MSETNGARFVKETSQFNSSSSRIYYYNGASVPFVWEIQPGTPKHSLFCESFRLPPLTPPPSYYSASSGNKKKKQTQFVKTLFNGKHPSFSWSSSSSSSSSFSSSSSRSKREQKRKCYLSCSRSYVEDDEEEEENRSSTSPKSTLGYKRRFSSSMGSMKRALCFVLSHRS